MWRPVCTRCDWVGNPQEAGNNHVRESLYDDFAQSDGRRTPRPRRIAPSQIIATVSVSFAFCFVVVRTFVDFRCQLTFRSSTFRQTHCARDVRVMTLRPWRTRIALLCVCSPVMLLLQARTRVLPSCCRRFHGARRWNESRTKVYAGKFNFVSHKSLLFAQSGNQNHRRDDVPNPLLRECAACTFPIGSYSRYALATPRGFIRRACRSSSKFLQEGSTNRLLLAPQLLLIVLRSMAGDWMLD